MKTSGNPIALGSESCDSIEHISNYIDQIDYSITKVELINNDLVIHQNPRNILKTKLTNLEEIDQELGDLKLNKVENTFILDTTDGLHGGGALKGNKLIVGIKSNDPHIQVDKNGLLIKKFTEVSTSGVVPSPAIKDTSHFLSSQGDWMEISQLDYIGEITSSVGFPNPDTLVRGMLYTISDLGDPVKTIENSYTGKVYTSEDVLLWNVTDWVKIGKVNTRVNLDISKNPNTNIISNTAGRGITLSSATISESGLLSASDKLSINKFLGIKSLDSISSTSTGVNVNYIEKSFESRVESSKSLLIPLVTPTSNGVLSSHDKIKLNNLPAKISISGIKSIGETLNLQNTNTDLESGQNIINNIELPLSSYSNDNFVNGLISGRDYKKLKRISGYITLLGLDYNMEDIRVTFQKYNSDTQQAIGDFITLPIASTTRNGLLSKNDKIKLDSLSKILQKQADYNITDPEDVAYIKNKPNVLTPTGVAHSLIPSTLNLQNKESQILNANGEWVNLTLSRAPITVSTTEPTDPKLRVDGAIWIKLK